MGYNHHQQLEIASILSGMIDDILIEVLLRLPYKLFIQLQCVSKRWYSLISTLRHTFNKPWVLYPDRQITKLKFFIGSDYENPLLNIHLPFFSENPDPDQNTNLRLMVKASFNDLIVCQGYCYKERNTLHYICNPLTNQYLLLPPFKPCRSFLVASGFICEPYIKVNKNNDTGVFSSTFRFRVVIVTSVSMPHIGWCRIMQIYSSETGLWTEHSMACPSGLHCSAYVQKFVAACGHILMWLSPKCHGPKAIMFDPFTATNNKIIHGHLIPQFDDNIEIFTCQNRFLLVKIVSIEGQPEPTLTVWELEVEAEIEGNRDKDQWRVVHRVAICEMEGGSTTEDNLRDWKEDIVKDEADPYRCKYKKSWIANFFKIALTYPFNYPHPSSPPLTVKSCCFLVRCLGFDPSDANVMFLMLGILLNENLDTFCIAMYDMRTKAINVVPEEQMPDNFYDLYWNHSILRDHFKDLYPVVAQPWPSLL